ncbi:MAG: hypothetical protein HQL69_21290, partial [Magnetococcales bacterium]|nr:hypothetical protein [Magnetococcales bacterium]
MMRSRLWAFTIIALLFVMNIALFEYLIASRVQKGGIQQLSEKTAQIHQLLKVSAEEYEKKNQVLEDFSKLNLDHFLPQHVMGKIFASFQEQYPAGMQFKYILNRMVPQSQSSDGVESRALKYFQDNSQAKVWFDANANGGTTGEYQYFHPVWLQSDKPTLHGVTRISVPQSALNGVTIFASDRDIIIYCLFFLISILLIWYLFRVWFHDGVSHLQNGMSQIKLGEYGHQIHPIGGIPL